MSNRIRDEVPRVPPETVQEPRTRWFSVGVILRVRPNCIEHLMADLKTRDGVMVVFYQKHPTRRFYLRLEDEDEPQSGARP